MLILYPVEGLANRMRTIDSAFRWSKRFGIPVRVRWWCDPRLLDARWRDLFEPITGLSEASDKANARFLLAFKLKRHSRLFRWLLSVLEKLRLFQLLGPDDWAALRSMAAVGRKKHCLITIVQSFSVFFWPKGENFQSELFKPAPELRKRIEEETARFNEHTVGVHIRRTDHKLAIAQSPDEVFVKAIERRISEDDASFFYICSDDADTKDRLMEKFGPERVFLPQGALSRNSKEGILQAVVELFSLAKTSMIIGSTESSFSEMATYLGEIPIVRAKQ